MDRHLAKRLGRNTVEYLRGPSHGRHGCCRRAELRVGHLDMMAGIFAAALAEQGGGVFDEVVFAVMDWSPEQHFIGPFLRAFS